MSRAHVDHREVSRFAEEKVNLPKDRADEYRAQAGRVRDKLEAYISDHPDFALKRIMLVDVITLATRITNGVIDLKDGKCVRLQQGDMQAATTFGDDPAAMARRWLDAGARLVVQALAAHRAARSRRRVQGIAARRWRRTTCATGSRPISRCCASRASSWR